MLITVRIITIHFTSGPKRATISYTGDNMNMKSLILITILTVILVNCGTNKTKVEPAYQTPEVLPYIEMLDADLKAHNLPFNVYGVIVTMTDKLTSDKLGQASFAGNKLTVYINAEYWPKLSELARKELVYHEFGHIMGLRHNPALNEQGKPVSIMYPYNLSLYATSYFEPNANMLFTALMHELTQINVGK